MDGKTEISRGERAGHGNKIARGGETSCFKRGDEEISRTEGEGGRRRRRVEHQDELLSE